jgi:hypothetical protein
LNPKTDVGSAMVAREVDGAWQPSVYIEPPVGINSTLSGVSCVSAGNCVAVGSYVDSAGVTVPMYVDETDGHWAQAVEIAIPAGRRRRQPERGGLLARRCVRRCRDRAQRRRDRSLVDGGHIVTRTGIPPGRSSGRVCRLSVPQST